MKSFIIFAAAVLAAGCTVSRPEPKIPEKPITQKNAALRKTSGFAGLVISADAKTGKFTILVPVPYDPAHARPAEQVSVEIQPDARLFLRTQWSAKQKIAQGTPARFFLNREQLENLKAGKTFRPDRVEIEPGLKLQTEGAIKVLPAEFTSAREGQVEFNGNKIAFRTAAVFQHTPCSLKDILPGYTKVRVSGKMEKGICKADYLLFRALPDPRKTDDPGLPRVLVIGDSISMNYHNAAKAALKGKFNYHRIDGNSGDSNNGNRNLDIWLGPMREKWQKWDVVVLNHGLHDLKQKGDRAKKSFSPEHQVEPELYRKNIENLLTRLTAHSFKVIVCTTTPVPNDNFGTYGRRKDEDLKYNAILLETVKKFPQVQVCDLNKVVRSSRVFDNWRKGNNVHYREAERIVLGKIVAEAILKAYK